MTECATFADDIKFKGGMYQKGWHFIDTPMMDEGGKISDYNFTADEHNITEVIGALSNWFAKGENYQESYEYKTIMSHTYKIHTEEEGASTAMRLLIHYVGDIHQPLHATSRVNHEYPEGDKGGNAFPLPAKDGANELHAVWDSVIYEFTGYPKTPFSDADWDTYTKNAEDLMARYPLTDAESNEFDSTVWAAESLKISKEVVYVNDKENVALSADYIAKAKPIAEKRIVQAGTRLANLLSSFKLALPLAAEEPAFLQ